MVRTFAHPGLSEVFQAGRSRRIGAEYHKRLQIILDALAGATCVADLRGVRNFHALGGDRAGTYAISVSGNYRVTFKFEKGDAGDVLDVDFEDYH